MFFDRYEIRIQAFADFIHGKLIIFRSSSPQNYFRKYILKIRPLIGQLRPLIIGAKIKKSWNFEFGASKIMKSDFYYTKMKQKKTIEILNILFEYLSIIKWP